MLIAECSVSTEQTRFDFQIGFSQPCGEVFVGGAGHGHAPQAVFGNAQAYLSFARAAFFSHPDHHETGSHVAALQAHDEPAFQCSRDATKAGAAGGNIESLDVLREHLTLTVQTPQPYGDGCDYASLTSLGHSHMIRGDSQNRPVTLVIAVMSLKDRETDFGGSNRLWTLDRNISTQATATGR